MTIINSLMFGVVAVLIYSTCNAVIHNTGTRELADKLLFSKVIFKKTTTEPANYTIIFKYIGSESSTPINFAEVDTHKVPNSTCYFEINQENDKEKILQATITIVNATDVEVSTAIHGSNFNVIHSDINSMKKMQMLMSEERTAKTFTVIYRHNGTQTRNRRFNLGQRQIGDKQLHFETKNATIGFRFAETEFKYNDPNKFITAIGFSLESPTAIAFVNSTFVKENAFNAIVYDLNAPSFVANMSVFGYDNFDKPTTYTRIVNVLQTNS